MILFVCLFFKKYCFEKKKLSVKHVNCHRKYHDYNGQFYLKSIHPLWKISEMCTTKGVWISNAPTFLCNVCIRCISERVDILFRSVKWASLHQMRRTPPVQDISWDFHSGCVGFIWSSQMRHSERVIFKYT